MAVLLAVLLAITSSLAVTSSDDAKPSKDDFKLSKNETRMIEAINKYRAGHDLPPLTMDPTLMKVARYRVPYFTHNYQGRWMWDEAKRFGFNGFATDDLSQGDQSPEEAVNGWAHSPVGHAQQMQGKFKMNGRFVDCHFDKVGVAQSGKNYIAIFGKRDGEPREEIARHKTADEKSAN
ncbi:MAG TPA: CAP domain-containing protein [Lacipirellulaceae bacterium]|nr:CAP domain-containing protein [Lacipirellulaceae bacterium]